MVRLVFRPYAQIRRSICTSEPLRPSTRVSSGFSLFRHSSPSFGSQRARSCSTPPSRRLGSAGDAPPPKGRISPRLLSLCSRVSYCPAPRARVRLLGPCFKTGRRGDRLQSQTPGASREPPKQAGDQTTKTASSFRRRLPASPGAPAPKSGRGISPRPSGRDQPRAYNTRPKASYLAHDQNQPDSRSRSPPNASAAARCLPRMAAPEGRD